MNYKTAMKTRLRNVTNPLYMIGQCYYEKPYVMEKASEYGEDIEIKDYIWHEVFADPINNNVISMQYCASDVDDYVPANKFESVVNSITPAPYDYLINVLNTRKNTLIHWSKIFSTTSDYEIFYDIVENCNMASDDINDLLDKTTNNGEYNYYKYIEVINGLRRKIEF